jgi:hypothetical protein
MVGAVTVRVRWSSYYLILPLSPNPGYGPPSAFGLFAICLNSDIFLLEYGLFGFYRLVDYRASGVRCKGGKSVAAVGRCGGSYRLGAWRGQAVRWSVYKSRDSR